MLTEEKTLVTRFLVEVPGLGSQWFSSMDPRNFVKKSIDWWSMAHYHFFFDHRKSTDRISLGSQKIHL